MIDGFASIPAHWTMSRVDRVATVNARIGWKALTAAEYQPAGYAFLATPNIKEREIDFEDVNYISEYRYHESPELKLKPNDVLLAKDGSTLGIVNLVRTVPRPATVNGSIAVLRPFGIDANYLRYLIASDITQGRIGSVKDGMGVPHLFQWDIKRLPVPIPPPDEQRRVAEFLDVEIARIDQLVTLRARQSATLALRRQSFSSEIAAELSGKYGTVRLRHVLMGIEQGWSPQCEDRLVEGDEWGVVKAGCVNSGSFDATQHKTLPADVAPLRRYKLRAGDVLMSRASGSIDLIGSVGIVPDAMPHNLLLCDKIYRLRLDRTRVEAEFVTAMLRTLQAREQIKFGISGAEGMANNLPTSAVKDLALPDAPRQVQRVVARNIQAANEVSAEAGRALEQQLTLLAERRRALITAAVTGQFDVTTARTSAASHIPAQAAIRRGADYASAH